jgi:hypothetical protein
MRLAHIAVALSAVAVCAGGICGSLAQSVITPIPLVLYPADISAAPYKWVGRLVTPNPAAADSFIVCTAQFITPNVILTAGHCIKDLPSYPTGPWADPSTGQFQLQYNGGDATAVMKIVCGLTNPLWAYPADYNSLTQDQQQAAQDAALPHDFAMLLVDGISPTGVMPYALDWKGKYQNAKRIGYPGDILSGYVMVWAPGIVFSAAAIPLPVGANSPNLVVQWGPVTDATEGMSGGAWVETDDSNNTLIAVTSFNSNIHTDSPTAEVPGFPGGTWAAYLTAAEFNPLLLRVQNGCR